MFKFLAIIISVIVTLMILLVIFYFLPADIKLKTLQAVTGIVPESIKSQIEELVLTPPEKRAKILDSLKDNLSSIKDTVSEKITDSWDKPGETREELNKLIKEAETLIGELEKKNEDASITNVVTSKLADQLIGETKPIAPQTQNKPECNCTLKKSP